MAKSNWYVDFVGVGDAPNMKEDEEYQLVRREALEEVLSELKRLEEALAQNRVIINGATSEISRLEKNLELIQQGGGDTPEPSLLESYITKQRELGTFDVKNKFTEAQLIQIGNEIGLELSTKMSKKFESIQIVDQLQKLGRITYYGEKPPASIQEYIKFYQNLGEAGAYKKYSTTEFRYLTVKAGLSLPSRTRKSDLSKELIKQLELLKLL